MKCGVQYSINNQVLPSEVKYFKEELVSEILTIPPQKPDMERLLKVIVDTQIVNTKLIETEEGYSNEGQRLTGYKLIVEVNLREKITYVADEATQSVHAAHFETMKSMFIVLPKEFKGQDMCQLVRANRVIVTPYLEGVKAMMLDHRRIHKCIMLFLDAKIC